MKPTFPKVIVLLDGRKFPVAEVHHQMQRGGWRVSWIDERPKGTIAEVVGEEFRELAPAERPPR
jgi:hypothetical protein